MEEALEFYQDILNKNQQLSDGENEAKTLKKVGLVYLYKGNSKDALPYWEKELIIHRELGENGAGKTTLIKILAGLIHPTSV